MALCHCDPLWMKQSSDTKALVFQSGEKHSQWGIKACLFTWIDNEKHCEELMLWRLFGVDMKTQQQPHSNTCLHLKRNFLVKHWGWFADSHGIALPAAGDMIYTTQQRQKVKAMIEYGGVIRNCKAKIISGSIISFLSICLPPTAVTLSGFMSTASCLGVTVDLIDPLGRGKSSQILPQQKIHGSNASCHSWHSAPDTFKHQSETLRGKTSYESSSLASRSLSQKPSGSGCLRLQHSWRVVKGISTGKLCDFSHCLTILMHAFNCHYPIFNPRSRELLKTMGAHTTWFCHLSGVWMKRKMKISIEPRGTQPLCSRWIEQEKSLRGVRRRSYLTIESK